MKRTLKNLEFGGGVYAAGDSSMAPEGTVPDMRGLSPHRYGARQGDYSRQVVRLEGSYMVPYRSEDGEKRLFVSGPGDKLKVVNSDGSVTNVGFTTDAVYANDGMDAFGRVWVAGPGWREGFTSPPPYKLMAYPKDMATVADFSEYPIGDEFIYGSTITSAINRIFLADVRWQPRFLFYSHKMDTNAVDTWTATSALIEDYDAGVRDSGGLVVNGRRFSFSVSTGKIHSHWISLASTPNPHNRSFRLMFTLQGAHTAEVPLTFKLVGQNPNGSEDVLATREIIVSKAADSSEFLRYTLPVDHIPALYTAFRVEIVPGITGMAAVTGANVNLTSGEIGYKEGIQVTRGYMNSPLFYADATNPLMFPDELWWTETDNTNKIISSARLRLADMEGEITCIRATADKFLLFKRNGVAVYTFTDHPDLPLSYQSTLKGFGVSSPRDVHVADTGEIYVRNDGGVWVWDGMGSPQQLANEGVRDLMPGATGFITFDPYNRILYVGGDSDGVLWSYYIDDGVWAKSAPHTAEGDAVHSWVQAEPVGTGRDTRLVAYAQGVIPPGYANHGSAGWAWHEHVVFDDAATTNTVLFNDLTDTRSESLIEFRPIVSDDPQNVILVESLEIHFRHLKSTDRVTLFISASGMAEQKVWDSGSTVVMEAAFSGPVRIPVRIAGSRVDLKLVVAATRAADPFIIERVNAWVNERGPSRRMRPVRPTP